MSLKKTVRIARHTYYGTSNRYLQLWYRGKCVYGPAADNLEAIKEVAKKLGFTHALYEGTFSGPEQPKPGPL